MCFSQGPKHGACSLHWEQGSASAGSVSGRMKSNRNYESFRLIATKIQTACASSSSKLDTALSMVLWIRYWLNDSRLCA